jgi:hypothetical protein
MWEGHIFDTSRLSYLKEGQLPCTRVMGITLSNPKVLTPAQSSMRLRGGSDASSGGFGWVGSGPVGWVGWVRVGSGGLGCGQD